MNNNDKEKALDEAIENLEEEINKIKKENKKNQKIRNMKVFNIKLLKTSSFVVAGTLFLGTIGPLTIDTLRDSASTDEYSKTIYTSAGIEKTINIDEKTYNNTSGYIKIYSKEKENDSNGKYRILEIYDVSYTDDYLKNIVFKNEIPKDDIKYFKRSLVDTEIVKGNELSYIDANSNEQYMIAESRHVTHKGGITFLEFTARFLGISALAALELVTFYYLRRFSSKIYNKKIEDWGYKWDVKYPIYSTKDLEEKLKEFYSRKNSSLDEATNNIVRERKNQ